MYVHYWVGLFDFVWMIILQLFQRHWTQKGSAGGNMTILIELSLLIAIVWLL